MRSTGLPYSAAGAMAPVRQWKAAGLLGAAERGFIMILHIIMVNPTDWIAALYLVRSIPRSRASLRADGDAVRPAPSSF